MHFIFSHSDVLQVRLIPKDSCALHLNLLQSRLFYEFLMGPATLFLRGLLFFKHYDFILAIKIRSRHMARIKIEGKEDRSQNSGVRIKTSITKTRKFKFVLLIK